MHGNSPSIQVLCSDWPDYALLDTGRRRKLERFGSQVIIRTEPKAWWEPTLPESEWAKAYAIHEEENFWRLQPGTPREWTMRWREMTLQAKLTDASKHLGVFPEQAPHWEFIQAHGPQGRAGRPRPAVLNLDVPRPNLLNLFGYTGAATLAAVAAGFAVTHVDASKPAITWARHNQKLSNLEDAPIRWILDDAVKFVRREIKRGVRYDAIALDPPSFGRGPNGEVWKVETGLPELLALCREAMVVKPLFVLMTLYNIEASSLMLGNMLDQTMHADEGNLSLGELALRPASNGRILPLSLWARWEGR
jgi:23S rRNA (cytosine1962-C5)-methyltransferase